jgi:hypothetical protein
MMGQRREAKPRARSRVHRDDSPAHDAGQGEVPLILNAGNESSLALYYCSPSINHLAAEILDPAPGIQRFGAFV